MAQSLVEYLRSDMECEGLLECLHGLKALDRECFRVLAASEGPVSVDELAEGVDRERSTVYRSVQRLLEADLVSKEQVNYEQGGYYHVYQPMDAEEIAAEMHRLLNDWYAKMGQLIAEFEETYGDPPAAAVED